MPDWDALRSEISNDPLVRGYSNMSDEEIAADLNTKYRTKNRTEMSASEVVNAVSVSEYAALAAGDKQLFWDIVHIGTLNPFGREADLMVTLFGGGSDTIATLSSLRVDSISRAEELGYTETMKSDTITQSGRN